MPARLKEIYNKEVRKKLQDEFKIENVMAVPKIEKVVLNMGVGEAIQNAKILDNAVEELATITGQRPVITRDQRVRIVDEPGTRPHVAVILFAAAREATVRHDGPRLQPARSDVCDPAARPLYGEHEEEHSEATAGAAASLVAPVWRALGSRGVGDGSGAALSRCAASAA